MPDKPNLITAEAVIRDGCPALGRTKAFVVHSGVCATLEHRFTDRNGQPIDLSGEDEANAPRIAMRIREETGIAGNAGQIYESAGILEDPATGVVQIELPKQVACSSGLYRADWACLNSDNEPVLINSTLVSVERSLFDSNLQSSVGIPSLKEIRTQIMDTAGDNTLLDDVEFTDDQILSAMLKPIQDWDESLPPLHRKYTTRSFPWRNKWIDASIGYLYRYAAAHYRRNRFISSGGGKQIDDKNREREYLAASQLHLDEWTTWRIQKKISLNGQSFHGTIWGAY